MTEYYAWARDILAALGVIFVIVSAAVVNIALGLFVAGICLLAIAAILSWVVSSAGP